MTVIDDRTAASVTTAGPEKFVVSVPQKTLDDLRARLLATRWPADVREDETYYGTSVAYMKELVAYWIDEFDWRAAEAEINSYDNYRAIVDGIPIHYLREPGRGPAPIPLILTHGWPWSFREWTRVVKQLADPGSYGGDPADAFEVIVPSLPGFGFSAPTGRTDLNFWKMSELWHSLMTEHLGFGKYAAGGADYGALVTAQLGHARAADLHGIWLGHPVHLDVFQGERPWDGTGGFMVPPGVPDEIRDGILAFQYRYASHSAVHILDSQNLSFGLADSPVGMLAWILRRWTEWSESGGDVESVFPRDHLLANATMWWVGNTITTSIRAYINSNRYPWMPAHDRTPIIEAPTGFTFLGFENPPGVTTGNRARVFLDDARHRGWYNPVHIGAHEHGGHFTPWENPEAVIQDIRATFRTLR